MLEISVTSPMPHSIYYEIVLDKHAICGINLIITKPRVFH
jgi:hypothetical protein